MCERRRAPAGTVTAFSTLPGGWPAEMIGARASRPPVARSVVPATDFVPLAGALAGVDRKRAAGFMVNGRPAGGRGGAGGEAVASASAAAAVVVDDSSMRTEPRTPPAGPSLAAVPPAEVVDRPVAGPEAPPCRALDGAVDEVLGRPHGLERVGAQCEAGRDGGRQ